MNKEILSESDIITLFYTIVAALNNIASFRQNPTGYKKSYPEYMNLIVSNTVYKIRTIVKAKEIPTEYVISYFNEEIQADAELKKNALSKIIENLENKKFKPSDKERISHIVEGLDSYICRITDKKAWVANLQKTSSLRDFVALLYNDDKYKDYISSEIRFSLRNPAMEQYKKSYLVNFLEKFKDCPGDNDVDEFIKENDHIGLVEEILGKGSTKDYLVEAHQKEIKESCREINKMLRDNKRLFKKYFADLLQILDYYPKVQTEMPALLLKRNAAWWQKAIVSKGEQICR
ncbi:MAG: hypothetical protein LBD50_01015 [Rickettsiales bacterium]|nr:hypothetical protein [Rickettsiales bacterium]